MKTAKRHNPGACSGRAGFTLLEIIVAVGAVAIVSAGLAAVFNSVGKTVATGRRVSRNNQVVRLLEQQMRQDFARMTRDGFFAIRQQYADRNGDGMYNVPPVGTGDPGMDAVAISPEERPIATGLRPGRVRRVDEMVFFTRGDFESQRKPYPQDPSWRPTSGEALVYYGHGQRDRDTLANAANYLSPKVNDVRNRTNDRLGLQSVGNPNQYAADWMLLRHQTLLVSRQGPTRRPEVAGGGTIFDLAVPVSDGAMNVSASRLRDRECQVYGQAASPGVFRVVNRRIGPETVGLEDEPATANGYAWYTDWTPPPGALQLTNYDAASSARGPLLASGLVDIATTDLSEVRRFASSSQNSSAGAGTFWPSTYTPTTQPRGVLLATAVGSGQVVPEVMQAWMNEAFPAEAVYQANRVVPATDVNADPRGVRMRYEPDALNLLDVLAPEASTPAAQRSKFLTKADRLQLQASNLSPNVTEFQIDWSFGQVDAANNIVWYGRPDDKPSVVPMASPGYVIPTASLPLAVGSQGKLYGAANRMTTLLRVDKNGDGDTADANDLVYPRLINGPLPTAADLCWTSYFGYVDPMVPVSGVSPDQTAEVVAWAWPKLVRVRVTLCDPADPKPENEQTFEFVFDVPKGS